MKNWHPGYDTAVVVQSVNILYIAVLIARYTRLNFATPFPNSSIKI